MCMSSLRLLHLWGQGDQSFSKQQKFPFKTGAKGEKVQEEKKILKEFKKQTFSLYLHAVNRKKENNPTAY